MLGEKRTDRLDVPRQLRVSGPMGFVVRRLAQQGGRTYQQQLVFLVTKGIQRHCEETGNEFGELIRQAESDSVR